MKIDKFWVVTVPTPSSVFDDIFFQTDIQGLELQFKGGLKASDVCGMYTEELDARRAARTQLALRALAGGL